MRLASFLAAASTSPVRLAPFLAAASTFPVRLAPFLAAASTSPVRLAGFLLACLLAFLFPAAAGARTVLPVSTEQDSNIKIQVESCFSQLPACGYMPVEVTINNSSGRGRTWKLHFASPAGTYGMYSSAAEPEQIHFSTSVSLESGAARTFKMLVPISTSDQNSTLSVELSGYGVPADGATLFFPDGSRSGMVLTPCMAVSEGASAQLGKHLEEAAKAESRQIHEVTCRSDELPDDWRALSGFAGIWLLDSEWNALPPAQRTAVEDWVATGGKLLLCAKAAPAPPQRKGLGSIVGIDLRSLDRAVTSATWDGMLRGDVTKVVNDDRIHWKSAEEIGVLKPNLPLLISFLAIFATVVGPVNLFVFGREGKRSRLYWTVPAISVGATAVLLLLIIFMDGFGGGGVRSALICLVPSARKAVIIQEQISRTGVVGSAAFSLRDPAWMTLVNFGGRSRAGRNAPIVRNADLQFDQDWFKSRSVQAHWLESVIPTRAEVALVNPEEAREGHAAPMIISSIAAPLRDFCFWDSKGNCWRATNVRTGVKTTLSPGKALDDPLAEARAPLRRRMTAIEDTRGRFVGVSGDAASFIDTLSSIRWRNGPAVYVGPVTGAETPK